MKLSELLEEIEKIQNDLPEDEDPVVWVIDETGFQHEVGQISSEAIEIYAGPLVMRTDYTISVEAKR